MDRRRIVNRARGNVTTTIQRARTPERPLQFCALALSASVCSCEVEFARSAGTPGEIAALPPAPNGRKVVCAGHGTRFAGPFGRVEEFVAAVVLEPERAHAQHSRVCEAAPKTRRDRAQILRDHEGTV